MMSKVEESVLITFKVNLDEVKCPSCNQVGTMVCITEKTKDGTYYRYHCINKKCREIPWVFAVIITEDK